IHKKIHILYLLTITKYKEEYYMGSLGGTEIFVILLVVLLFFGAKRIPELARGIGQGMNEFRKASDQIKDELQKGKDEGFNTSTSTEKEPEKVKSSNEG